MLLALKTFPQFLGMQHKPGLRPGHRTEVRKTEALQNLFLMLKEYEV